MTSARAAVLLLGFLMTTHAHTRGMIPGTVVMGTGPQDRRVSFVAPDVSPTPSAPPSSPMQAVMKSLHGMIHMTQMTDPSDPVSYGLNEIMHDMDSQMKKKGAGPGESVSLRTRGGGEEVMAQSFEDRVRILLAASGVETVLPLDCGRDPRNDSHPLEGSHPWVVALGSSEDGRFYYRCTGVLVAPYHILTDADCVSSANINKVLFNVTGRVPSAHNPENYVVGRRIHPMVKESMDLLGGHNVGLLELAQPVEFNDYVQPICLPGVFDTPDSDAQYYTNLVGFDNITDTRDGRVANFTTYKNQTVLGSARCERWIKRDNDANFKSNLFSILTDNHMCAFINYDLVGKSVALSERSSTGRVQVVGVAGVANARIPRPVAYTLVQPHRFWVELVIRKFNKNLLKRRGK